METWRRCLLLALLVASIAGYAGILIALPALAPRLGLLTGAFALGTSLGLLGHRSGPRFATSRLAITAVLHLAAAVVVATGSLAALIGGFGVVMALLTWRPPPPRKHDDALTRAATALDWGAQKLPELADLDASDLQLARLFAEVRARRSGVEQRMIDLRRLEPLHPIDRTPAEDKVEERTEAVRQAMPLLRRCGMCLTEAMVATCDELVAFRSVTGFQAVELDGRFVVLEGNGRREALIRAIGDQPLLVEVSVHQIRGARANAAIRRRIREVRARKDVTDPPPNRRGGGLPETQEGGRHDASSPGMDDRVWRSR